MLHDKSREGADGAYGLGELLWSLMAPSTSVFFNIDGRVFEQYSQEWGSSVLDPPDG